MRYLIYSASGIGDFFIALPCAEAIRRADPKAEIVFYSCSDPARIAAQKELLPLQRAVNRVVYYSIKEPLHTLSFILRLGHKTFDYALVVYRTYAAKIYTPWAARIANWVGKKSVGIEVTGKSAIHFDIEIPSSHSLRQDYNALLDAVGIEPLQSSHGILPKSSLYPYLKTLSLCKTTGKRYVGLCVGTGNVTRKVNGKVICNDSKNWPYQRWVELAQRLLRANYEVVLLGGKKERQEMDVQGICVPQGAVDLIGNVELKESIAVTSACSLVVCGDTGLMHAADAAGTPVLVLLGCSAPNVMPDDPQNRYIISDEPCCPCDYYSDEALYCKDKKCMAYITVEMVYDQIIEMLGTEEGRKNI